MPVIGRGDEDRVNVVAIQQAAKVEISFALADLFRAIHPPLIHVANRRDLDVLGLGFLREAINVRRTHSSNSDDSDANAVVCPDRPQTRRRRDDGGSARKSGSLEKISTGSGGKLHSFISQTPPAKREDLRTR